MRALLKFLAAVFGLLLLFFVAAVLLLNLLINPNKYKAKIEKQVYHLTGRLVTVSNISWTVFPKLGIKATDVVLSNPVGLSKKMFASAKSAEVTAEFLPLLHGHIKFGDLVFDGLTVNLVKDIHGVNNWRDFETEFSMPTNVSSGVSSGNLSANNTSVSNATVSNTTANNAIASSTSVNSTPQQQPVSFANLRVTVSISGITITNGTLNWEDLQNQTAFTLNNINFSSHNMGLDHPFPLSLAFTFNGTKPSFVGNINLNSNVIINKEQQSLILQNVDLKASRLSNQYPDGHLDATLNSDISLTLGKQIMLALPHLHASIANMQLQGNVQSDPTENLQLHGNLDIADFNLKNFLVSIGNKSLQPKDSTAMQNCSAHFLFQANQDGLKIQQLQMQLDKTNISGNVAINNFSVPQITMKLHADTIDLSRYASAKSAQSNKITIINNNAIANNSSASGQSTAGIFPVSTLQQLNLNGTVSVDALHYSKLDMTGFSTQIAANAGLIKLNSLRANVYQGQTNSNITLDVRSATPNMIINTKLTGINIGQLLTDSADITKIKVAGNGNLTANVTASGNTSLAIKQTLSGNTRFSVSNGVLYGVDIPYYSDFVDALIHKHAATRSNSGSTAFGNLTGTATINNGLVSNNDLSIQGTGLTATGSGTANLVTEQLNYKIIMKQAIGDVPLNITGSFSHPSIKPDILAIAQKQIVKTLTNQVEQKLGGHFSQTIQNFLGTGSGSGSATSGNNNGNNNSGNNSNGGNAGQQLQQGLKSLLGQ